MSNTFFIVPGSGSSGPGEGLANIDNVGDGVPLYLGRQGDQGQLLTLKAGQNVTLQTTPDGLVINAATAGGSLVWNPSLLPDAPPLELAIDQENAIITQIAGGFEIQPQVGILETVSALTGNPTNFNTVEKKGFYFSVDTLPGSGTAGAQIFLSVQNFINDPTLQAPIFLLEKSTDWQIIDVLGIGATGIFFTDAEILAGQFCIAQSTQDAGISYDFEFYIGNSANDLPAYALNVVAPLILPELFINLRFNSISADDVSGLVLQQFTAPPFLFDNIQPVQGNSDIDPASYPQGRENKTFIIDQVAPFPQSVNSVLGPVSDGISITFDSAGNPAGRTVRSLSPDFQINAYNSALFNDVTGNSGQ